MKHTLLASTFLATLVFAPTALTQETGVAPRDLLERAHYAENHEHDLAAAKSGYQAAIDAATARGETDVASQAGRALERVRVRLGEIAAPEQDELPADLVNLFIEAQVLPQGDSRTFTLARDMALYGDTATRVLAEWIRLPKGSASALITTAQRMVVANPYFAAAALGTLGTAQARAALIGALDTTDPLLRREIIALAQPDHGALFAMAIDDPIDALRTLAAQRLLGVDDPSVGAALETLVRRGVGGAEFQLGKVDPVRALSLLGDAAITPDQQDRLDSSLSQRQWRDITPAAVEHFMAVASAAQETRSRRVAEYALREMLQSKNLDDATDRDGVSAALERSLAKASPRLQLHFGWVLGSERLLILLEAFIDGGRGSLSEDDDELVERTARYCIESGANGAAIAERLFGKLLPRTDLSAVAAARPGQAFPNETATTYTYTFATSHNVGTPENDARVLRLFTSVPKEARAAFAFLTRNWCGWRLPNNPAQIVPGALDPRFADLAVALMQLDDASGAYSAASVARAVGTREVIERLLRETEFPFGCPSQGVNGLWQALPQSDWQHVIATTLATLEPLVAQISAPPRVSLLIQLGLDLDGMGERKFLRAVWALPLSDDLRTETYANFANFAQGDDVPALLLELYASLPATAASGRKAAIQRFGKSLHEPAIDLLGEALRDRDVGVREAAQAAFQQFRQHREALEEYEAWRQASDDARETVAQLVALLASDNKDVVRGAVEALGAVKARTALPQLVALLGRDDAELKAAVNKAIAAIGG